MYVAEHFHFHLRPPSDERRQFIFVGGGEERIRTDDSVLNRKWIQGTLPCFRFLPSLRLSDLSLAQFGQEGDAEKVYQ